MRTSQNIEIIYPENTIQKKVGTGGLPQHIIDQADKVAKSIKFDLEPYIKERIQSLKSLSADANRGFSAGNDNKMINSFLHDIVQLNTNAKLDQQGCLSLFSTNLLQFMTPIDQFNIDTNHVVSAHLKVMDIILDKNIKTKNNPTVRILLDELHDVCARYNTKHTT